MKILPFYVLFKHSRAQGLSTTFTVKMYEGTIHIQFQAY